MAFLIGPMQHHIEARKKGTESNEILHVNSDVVSISTAIGTHNATVCVNVGDEVKIGTLIAKRDDRFYVPVYSSVSGHVVAIEKKMSAGLRPADCVIIENNHKDEYEKFSAIDFTSNKEDVLSYMKEIGLLGQGGAGFPSYIKYATDKCETLIINAVECEPYITADYRNILENLNSFKKGVDLLCRISNAKKCLIGVKSYHKELVCSLKELFIGDDIVEIKELKDVYPMGWERTLTYSCIGKRYNKLPIEVGVIVSNATTVITLAKSIEEGHYQNRRIVTVSGDNINNPHNVDCYIGASVKELIEVCGGLIEDNCHIIMGGPMMGTCVTKDEVSITPISNAVNLFKEKKVVEYACLRCGRCVEHCPSSLEPVSIVEAYKFNDFDRLEHLHANDCVECGMCTYICPSKIEVTEHIRRAKKLMALKKK